MENLENILESILFVSGDAVDLSDISGKLDVTKADIKNAVKKLKNKYKEGSGIVLLEFNNKLQLASASAYSDEVSKVLNPIRQRNLSRATLETASIIAYKQPVTRLEIEEIRGVSSDWAINILLEHNLIEIVGRKDAVGKPVLFGTTDEFLKRFNISSISELPSYEELLEKVRVIRSGDDRLYNHFEIKSEDDAGDADAEQSDHDQEKIDTDFDELVSAIKEESSEAQESAVEESEDSSLELGDLDVALGTDGDDDGWDIV